MAKQRHGSIINMSSVVGVSGNAGQCNYSASKAGLIGLAKSIAKEMGAPYDLVRYVHENGKLGKRRSTSLSTAREAFIFTM